MWDFSAKTSQISGKLGQVVHSTKKTGIKRKVMARLGSHGTSSETGAVGLNKGGKKSHVKLAI